MACCDPLFEHVNCDRTSNTTQLADSWRVVNPHWNHRDGDRQRHIFSVSMVAAPDNSVSVGQWTFAITNLNPNWELMSGDDVGKKVYAVSVSVQGPNTSFIRQLISGYPQYTEDIVSTGDTSKPMARAIKSLGRALVDDSIVINLTHDVKDRFFVTQSAAVYMREVFSESGGLGNWVELPIDNLPRFNDHMPTSEDVWNAGTDTQLSPLTLSLTTNEENIQVQQEAVVTGYLRYAFPESRIVSGDELFPVVWITLRRGNESTQSVEMYAFNENLNTADPSLMTYRWVEDESELALLGKSLPPSIICNINSEEYVLPVTNNDEFGNIGDSEYAYRVLSVQNNLRISGVVVSLAQVEIKKGAKTWERWVFDNRSMNRDVIEGEQHNAENATFVDDAIQMKYSPGGAPITIVGGLEDGSYGLLSGLGDGEPQFQALVVGQQVPITDEVSLTLDRAESRTTSETRLTIVPRSQRDPAASNLYSMIKLVLPTPEGSAAAWLPYHQYPFKSESDTVHRFRYDPTLMQLPNGKTYQVLFSRRSEALPAPVVLDSFEIDSHVGGFTGRTSSVLNWRSLIRFLGDTEVSAAVSVNDPRRFGNYWFFQSQWDPPDSTSAGLNYTVLGVGNRFGVLQMLLGCCLTVSGMLWAFYVKPMIKRRRRQSVYEGTGA